MSSLGHGLLIVFSIVALLPSGVWAQEGEDSAELRAARFLFTEGNNLTDKEERARALKAFSLSFELYPAANTAVNIVGLLIDNEDFRSAKVWLEYARTLPDLSERAEVILTEFDTVIAEQQGRIKLELEDPTSLEFFVEDKPASAAALSEGVPLDPGRYYLEVKQQGMVTFGTNFEVREGKETLVRYKEHTIRRRQPSTVEPVAFTPPKRKTEQVAPPPPAPPPPPIEPVYEEPWFRALVATAVGMTVLSSALLINEAR